VKNEGEKLIVSAKQNFRIKDGLVSKWDEAVTKTT
jgi:hypothetical protein